MSSLRIPIHTKDHRDLSEAIKGWNIYGHDATYLKEGADYFYARIPVGQPPQYMDFIIDSGSGLPYIPCAERCKKCGTHTHPYYQAEFSNTYRDLHCDSDICQKTNRLRCDKKTDRCTFSISYAEGSAVTGSYFQELMEISGEKVDLFIGCIETETHLIYGQDADGIMGIANNELSIPNQILKNPEFHNTMQWCFAHGGGYMEFGDKSIPAEMTYQPMAEKNCRKDKFKLILEQIYINDEVYMPKGDETIVRSQEYCGTFFDTGCTDTLIKDKVLHGKLLDAIKDNMKYDSLKKEGRKTCYFGDVQKMKDTCPKITWDFGNGVKMDMGFDNMMQVKAQGKVCSILYNEGNAITIGGNAVKDNLIIIDKDKKRIGIMPGIDCQKRAETLNIDRMDEKETIQAIPPGFQKKHPETKREKPKVELPKPAVEITESDAEEPKVEEPISDISVPNINQIEDDDRNKFNPKTMILVVASVLFLYYILKKYFLKQASHTIIQHSSWDSEDRQLFRGLDESSESSSSSTTPEEAKRYTIESEDEI